VPGEQLLVKWKNTANIPSTDLLLRVRKINESFNNLKNLTPLFFGLGNIPSLTEERGF
jgi:hypothetical protein